MPGNASVVELPTLPPQPMRQAIVASDRTYVSAVCAWEISIKVVIGKLEFHGDIEGAITLRQVSNVLSEEKKQQVIALGRLG